MTFKEYGTGSFAPSVCSRLIYSYFPLAGWVGHLQTIVIYVVCVRVRSRGLVWALQTAEFLTFFEKKNTIKIRAELNVIVAVSCNYFILVSWQQHWWLKEVTWFTSGVKRTTRASLVKLKKFITLTRRHIWLFRCYKGIKVNRYALRTCWYFRFPTPDSSFSDFPFLNFFPCYHSNNVPCSWNSIPKTILQSDSLLSILSFPFLNIYPGFPFARQTAWIFHALYQFNTFFSLLLLHLL